MYNQQSAHNDYVEYIDTKVSEITSTIQIAATKGYDNIMIDIEPHIKDVITSKIASLGYVIVLNQDTNEVFISW